MTNPRTTTITPDLLLRAYARGIFPMADSADADEIYWVEPKRRGIFALDRFHISRSLRKRILTGGYRVTLNRDFAGVVAGCADRPETWINPQITALYGALHDMGRAHSIEVWQDDTLIGGTYGVTLGGAFMGESMFSRRTDASKVALAYLVDRLRLTGFTLFDTQFLTPHLASLGAQELPNTDYLDMLKAALTGDGDITRSLRQTPQDVIQRNGQTS